MVTIAAYTPPPFRRCISGNPADNPKKGKHMLKLSTIATLSALTLATTMPSHAADYGFIVRPHKGYWQIACFAKDFGREFLTMPWQGRFASRGAAERFARANVNCDY